MKSHLILIKLGGSTLDNTESIRQLAHRCQFFRAKGYPLILVHGGGKAINRVLELQQLQSSFIDGLRVTTPEMMDVIEMVLSGRVNKMIVRMLNAAGLSAFGLSGVDNQLLQCSPINSQLGRVGRINHINPTLIQTLLATQQNAHLGIIPVISPVGVDEHGQALNINADWAACELAVRLPAKQLIYLTDTPGIYDGDQQPLARVNRQQLFELITKKIVTGGMLAKVNAVIHALDQGVNPVRICSALPSESGGGALCTLCVP